ncbi:hypothetical protein [Pasteuria penetrans]|uniref:hypothetical protein n=1 Tax=Pasteuria penetrans TaxID=86005 RepID=UPI0011EBE013|nr:hypothetical protein [Pasteuria penetrans]
MGLLPKNWSINWLASIDCYFSLEYVEIEGNTIVLLLYTLGGWGKGDSLLYSVFCLGFPLSGGFLVH